MCFIVLTVGLREEVIRLAMVARETPAELNSKQIMYEPSSSMQYVELQGETFSYLPLV